MQSVAKIELTAKKAELFKRWLQFYEDWERLFNTNFRGSLTIHRDETGNKMVFEWREVTSRVIHNCKKE